MNVSLFYPQQTSLFQLLHSAPGSENNFCHILRNEPLATNIRIKYEIALQLSKIILTMHNLSSIGQHGHLTSHNVFIHMKKIASSTFEVKVRISDIETFDFVEYSNMFFNYRMTSVWSGPEALQQPKKIPELTQQMDTYSFGMILWELWHNAIPFDNDIQQAQQYVVNTEEFRPKLLRSPKDLKSEEHIGSKDSINESKSEHFQSLISIEHSRESEKDSRTFCDDIISGLIRKCWKGDPCLRPKFFEICQLLQTQINNNHSQEVVIINI